MGIAVASLCIMNIGVNVVMGPSRAVLNDLVDSDSLVTANSIATAVMGPYKTSLKVLPETCRLYILTFPPSFISFHPQYPIIMIYSCICYRCKHCRWRSQRW